MFSKIPGIGMGAARDLYANHNIRSLRDLKKRAAAVLTPQQLAALRAMPDVSRNIPASEVEQHRRCIAGLLARVTADAQFWIAGSYRRNLAKVRDLNVVVTGSRSSIFEDIVKLMRLTKYLVHTFSETPAKVRGVCRLPRHKSRRRIELTYASQGQLPFSMLYITGPIQFNVSMRNIARAKGYRLSERGIFDARTGRRIDAVQFHDERSIFDFLGVEWLEPWERNATNIVLVDDTSPRDGVPS